MSATEQVFTEAGLPALATKATNYGAATAVAGSFFLDNFIGIIGLAIALAGFLVNWYYKHQAHQRMEAEHKATLARLEANSPRPAPEPEH